MMIGCMFRHVTDQLCDLGASGQYGLSSDVRGVTDFDFLLEFALETGPDNFPLAGFQPVSD
jgi:hypothetical protein